MNTLLAIQFLAKKCRLFSTTPWGILKSKIPDVVLPNVPVHEHVFKNINKWQDNTALVCQQTGRSYKYYEVLNKSRSTAYFLRSKLKLQKGDTVAIVMPNVPEYAIIMLAASQAGLKLTTVNPLFSPDEILKQLIHSETKVVVTLSPTYPDIAKAVTALQKAMHIIVIKHEEYNSLPRDAIDFREISSINGTLKDDVDSSETFVLPYSSGTTGLPKAVELTHNSIVANISQILAPEFKLHKEAEGEYQDVVPLFLPMFHIYGMVIVMLGMMTGGCKLITIPKFGTKELLHTFQVYKPTVMYVVPPIVNLINKNPNFTREVLTPVRVMSCGAAPLGASDVQNFKDKTKGKVALLQSYGMTEASPVICLQSPVLENGVKYGGIGFLVPNTEAKIVATDGRPHGPNESGELYVRGPHVMKGYYKNEAATKECITEDGFLKTGDVAHYDEDQHFFVTDRLKELIKVKGFQVAPAELEIILRQHPEILDAAVVGVPHPTMGEAPKAFVVTKSGCSITADTVKNYVASKVANYKNLNGGVAFVESIPKNPSGKILRKVLRNL